MRSLSHNSEREPIAQQLAQTQAQLAAAEQEIERLTAENQTLQQQLEIAQTKQNQTSTSTPPPPPELELPTALELKNEVLKEYPKSKIKTVEVQVILEKVEAMITPNNC